MRFDENIFICHRENKYPKGSRVLDFALLWVSSRLHHGNEGVKTKKDFRFPASYTRPTPMSAESRRGCFWSVGSLEEFRVMMGVKQGDGGQRSKPVGLTVSARNTVIMDECF